MNRLYKCLLGVATIIGLVASVPANAHGGGGSRYSFGFVVGPWWWGPPSYYYPYYYPPTVVTAPVYVQPSTTQLPAPSYYWYYCAQSGAYYPYVTQCASAWQQVTPTPPPPVAPAAPVH
jgi:hypothetical protein